MDLERCDPEVFDALVDLLQEQESKGERERVAQEFKAKFKGGG